MPNDTQQPQALDFTVAGLSFRLAAPSEARSILRVWLGGIPCRPSTTEPEVEVTLRAEVLSLRSRSHRESWRFTTPEAGRLLVPLLLLRALSLLRPELLLIHGNALETKSGALLLAGESGAGKSTLSRSLCQGEDARLISEDVLILEPADPGPLLHPYPRAATHLHPPVPGAPLWRTGKWLDSAPVPGARMSPVPLAGAVMCILRRGGEQPQAEAGRWEMLVSYCDRTLADALGRVHPASAISEEDGFFRIGFQAAPGTRNFERLCVVLAEHGSLLIRSGDVAPRPAAPAYQTPAVRPLEAAEVLPALRRHLILQPESVAARSPARLMLEIARVFSDTRFLEVRRGGTPEDTAAALLAARDTLPFA